MIDAKCKKFYKNQTSMRNIMPSSQLLLVCSDVERLQFSLLIHSINVDFITASDILFSTPFF